MSRLTELIRQAKDKDPALGAELEREYRTLSGRRAFGLNFERHRPEAVELPGRPVRRGDKVRILPPRGSTERGDQYLWRVTRVERVDGDRICRLAPLGTDCEPTTVLAEDLVVVAEFRDPIHPGLAATGGAYRGGDKPAHTVINGENFHVLKALTYTHRGQVDAIYIDPPYNTGARDWKYNNDYVEEDDLYRHSKWLAFMERRLLLAKELLNPADSVLIVTIDFREVHRLALLLGDVFPESRARMISTTINPKGVGVTEGFKRVDEYLLIVRRGEQSVSPSPQHPLGSRPLDGPETAASDEDAASSRIGLDWQTARRRDLQSVRPTRPGQFYPIYVNETTGRIESVGEQLPHGQDRNTAPPREGCVAVFPVRDDGTEMNWAVTAPTFIERWQNGYARAGKPQPGKPQTYIIQYLKSGPIADIESGTAAIEGHNYDGSVVAFYEEASAKAPPTQWNLRSHNAEHYGTKVLRDLLPGRSFPFPKSLFAVEDALGLFIRDKPDAVVVDFFAGSGTTAHAVMRLNRQDGGRRQSISVTNNEVAINEQATLLHEGLRPGDPDWEQWGICEHITKPRIAAAITGNTPDGGAPVQGTYKFNEEFTMAEGFEESAEFFTLTYENPVAIGHNLAFERVAPLLWLRAGSEGRRIDILPEQGWAVADTYGILFDLDRTAEFFSALDKAERLSVGFIVTDDDRRFQSVVRQLPKSVDPVRLYESYLSNFRFTGSEP